jgi:hypothetical protein
LEPSRQFRFDAIRLALVLVSLVLFDGASPKALASESSASRLIYSRTPDAISCPDEAALRKAVAARVGYDPFFPWAQQTIVIQIWRGSGAFEARVQRLDDQGISKGTRELSSSQSDCAELFDTTALAVAIALDAETASSVQPAPSTAPLEVPAPPATQPPPPPESYPATSPPTRDLSPKTLPPSPPRVLAGIDAVGSLGTAPSIITAGGAVFVGARARFLSAALELRVDAPGSTTFKDTSSLASWIYAGSLVPCAHYGIGSACAVGMLGSLRGALSKQRAEHASEPHRELWHRACRLAVARIESLHRDGVVLHDEVPPPRGRNFLMQHIQRSERAEALVLHPK